MHKIFLRLILLLFCVSIATFTLIELSPIDPINAYITSSDTVSSAQKIEISRYFGLDLSPLERYFTWLSNIVRLDFGESIIYRQPVIDIIADKFVNSLVLMLSSWTLSGLIGLALGITMGAFDNSRIDKIIRWTCLTLSAIPTYLLGIILLLIFSVSLNFFPIGFSSPIGVLSNDVTILDRIYHLILPIAALSLSSFSGIALHTREKTVEVLKSDYALLSKTKGYSKPQIIRKHGKNILIPAITLQFSSLGEIFGGSVLAETVFSYDGLGSTVVTAGLRGDIPLLLGITIFSAIFIFWGNLSANILYRIIDPRVRGLK